MIETWLYLMRYLLMILGWWYQYAFVAWGCQEVSKLDFKIIINNIYVWLVWKTYFDTYTNMDLDVSVHVFMWCVGMFWAWLCILAYVCVMVHWHKHEKALSFLWMRKWILINGISVLWDFALGATSWSCVGATSWDYAGATSGRLEHHKVPRMVQSATHSTKCHNCRICISLKENEKVWKRQKEIFMNLF